MNVSATKKKPSSIKADLYVVPVVEKAETAGAVRELSAALRGAVQARVKRSGFHGKAGRTLSVQVPLVASQHAPNRSTVGQRQILAISWAQAPGPPCLASKPEM